MSVKIQIGPRVITLVPRPRSWFGKYHYELPFAITGQKRQTVNYLNTENKAERLNAAMSGIVAICLHGANFSDSDHAKVVDMVGVRLASILIDNPDLELREF